MKESEVASDWSNPGNVAPLVATPFATVSGSPSTEEPREYGRDALNSSEYGVEFSKSKEGRLAYEEVLSDWEMLSEYFVES